MVFFCNLDCHLLTDSHAGSSDYHEAFLAEFNMLLSVKVYSRNDMRKDQDNQKSPHCICNRVKKTLEKIANHDKSLKY
jgi:hypothetical protein